MSMFLSLQKWRYTKFKNINFYRIICFIILFSVTIKIIMEIFVVPGSKNSWGSTIRVVSSSATNIRNKICLLNPLYTLLQPGHYLKPWLWINLLLNLIPITLLNQLWGLIILWFCLHRRSLGIYFYTPLCLHIFWNWRW